MKKISAVLVGVLTLASCGHGGNDRTTFLQTSILHFVAKDLDRSNDEVIDSVQIFRVDSLDPNTCLVLASPAVHGTRDNKKTVELRGPHTYRVSSKGEVSYQTK